jgi:NodT family efflux transporter outer membrane factor (OMF) lipoprotein
MFDGNQRTTPKLLTGLAILLVTGCATVPEVGEPAKPARPGDYASTRSFGGARGEWPADQWWRDFGDPQLDGLVAEALTSSPTIDQAAARLQIASAQVDLARAALLPKTGLMATARYSRMTQSIGLPTDGKWQVLGAGLLSASYHIDLWGKNRSALRGAVSDRQANGADAAAARLTIAVAVASAYADLAELHLQRDVAVDALRLRRATLDLVNRRFDAGLDSRTSREQAAAGIDTATGELAATDEAIALNRNAIAALLGAGPDRGLDIQRPTLLTRRPPGLPADIGIGLVGRRPDVVAARWKVEAAAQRIGVAKAGFYPNVSLAGLIGVASFGLSNLFKEASVVGSAGPAISLPIFDGGRLQANYRGARGNYDLAVAQYDEALLRALHEAADAADSLRSLDARQRSADAAAARQESAYRLSRMSYEGGLSNYQSVLIAENALLEARDQAAALRLRGFVLDVALADALGGGFRGQTPSTSPTPADGAIP